MSPYVSLGDSRRDSLRTRTRTRIKPPSLLISRSLATVEILWGEATWTVAKIGGPEHV